MITVCICALLAISLVSIIRIEQNENTFICKSTAINEKDDLFALFKESVNDNLYVHIGGNPIGISASTDGIIVVDEYPVTTKNGDVYPFENIGIMKGDIITHINNEKITSIYQLKEYVKCNDSLNIQFIRGNKTFLVTIKPQYDINIKQKRIGLTLKEDVSGIGTMTFVTQDGKFASLGHHVSDTESGLIDELHYGNIYNTSITDIVKGEKGKAGALIGDVNRLSNDIGSICINSNIGLYGKYNGEVKGDLYRIAKKGEAKIGKAQVFTTIDGEKPKFYDIEIVKVVSQSSAGEKGMVISVCDKQLLEKTGGIVQGMSGSPIIQNGIIIGAVTHVFLQDCTRGYAIHSRFMYDMANSIENDNLTELNIQSELPIAA